MARGIKEFRRSLIGVSEYDPGTDSEGYEHRFKLSVIPAFLGAMAVYVRRLRFRISYTINQPASGAVASPWQDQYRVVAKNRLHLERLGTIIRDTITGPDMGHVVTPFSQRYRQIRHAAIGDTSTSDVERTLIYDVNFADQRLARQFVTGDPALAGIPGDVFTCVPAAVFTESDYFQLWIAPNTALTATATSSTVENLSIQAAADVVLLEKPLPLHLIERHFAETKGSDAEFTLGPYTSPSADILDAVLCGDLHGLGGGNGPDNILTVQVGPDTPEAVHPRWLVHRFLESLPEYPLSDEAWPYIGNGHTWDETGEDDVPVELAFLPLEWLPLSNPHGFADVNERFARNTALKVTTTATAAQTNRLIMRTLDRPDQSRENMIRAAIEAARSR